MLLSENDTQRTSETTNYKLTISSNRDSNEIRKI